MPSIKAITLSLALATLAAARTDLAGCTSSRTGASIMYYVPGTGEICDIPDCGGGRAPPITTNPACANYKGTATYSPSFLPGFTGAPAVSQGGDGQVQATSAAAAPAPVSQLGDGQPQAPTGAVSTSSPAAASTQTATAVSQLTDGQPQAPQTTPAPTSAPASTVSAVSQLTDGQPQAPVSSAAPASSAPAAPVQPSSVTVPAVSQITDGQPQAPQSTMTTSVSYGNGTVQGPTTVSGAAAPTVASSKAPAATFTGAASAFGFNKEVAGLAMGLAAGIAML